MSNQFVIFDADGVLLDSMSESCNVFNEIASEVFSLLPEVCCQNDLAHVYASELRPSLMRFGLTEAEARQFFTTHTERMLSRADQISAFHEVISAIAEALPGRCAIVSSSHQELIENVLAKSPSYREGMFYQIVGREGGGTKAQRIAELLQSTSTLKSEALYVGDMASDVIYCRGIGVPVACVGYGYHPVWHLKLFKPDYMFENTCALTDFLKTKCSVCNTTC